MEDEKKLTVETSLDDFRKAYVAKRKLIERQKEDFQFALGNQWTEDEKAEVKKAGFKPFTDNRIQPNIFLLTGLERQNRTDFRAFPEGEEDGVKSEIASALFKHSIKTSDFSNKSSDQFKDGVTCGESHLELFLDNTHDLLNGRPGWTKIDTNMVFPEPGCREYDFNDARYVYKVTPDLTKDDLISLYPEEKKQIEELSSGQINFESMNAGTSYHYQRKDYPDSGGMGKGPNDKQDGFDLIERYFKKWIDKVFIGDKKTGEIKEADTEDKADQVILEYQDGIERDRMAYEEALQRRDVDIALGKMVGEPPIAPPQQDPERLIKIKRSVPEIWCFAHVPGMKDPLCNERAWFYPEWKKYPFIPFFARFSTAPLTGDDRHLLVQGVVHGVKGAQEKHNKAEMLIQRHLNTATNSGWLSEEGAWVDPKKVESFGSAAGINLEYKKGSPKPEKQYPTPLSQGHAQISETAAEAIKAQLGINADLLAAQDSQAASGRAIALRQRQGLLMVQELFDNLARTRKIAGKFMLSQLGKMFDTETAKKVLGEAFLKKNFPPPMMLNEETAQPEPMADQDGTPMMYDEEMAEIAIGEVLSGELGRYDVEVGESVASETMRMANSAEIKEFSTTYPGVLPPEIIIEESQLPHTVKNRVVAAIKNARNAPQGAV